MDKPDFDRDVPLNCASVSVYSFLKSWVFQLPSEDDLEQYKGADVLKKVENVRLLNRYDSSKPSVGTLYLTATHLIFVGPDSKKETWLTLGHWEKTLSVTYYEHVREVVRKELVGSNWEVIVRILEYSDFL